MTSDDDISPFGVTNYRNKEARFGIRRDDRRRHMYVIGKTGMGKSTMLENMAVHDIRAGNGVAIVDPHGEFAEKMLDFVPEHRLRDVIFFNPADLAHPIALNVVEKVPEENRHLVTDGLVGVFEKLWAYTWGPRLEYILRNAILTLLEVPGATLLGVMRLLTDETYRDWAVGKVTDPVVRAFWIDEFRQYASSFASEAVAPIQNKVGQFVSNAMIRNIIGQEKTAIDFRKVMDEGKILIVNLSKGRVGEGGSQLLGALIITKLQLAAMSRVDMSDERQRRDFYLYVDEFQNFATKSFAGILSEARKYRLSLILAHQYVAQLEEEVRDAVFGNVGTIVSFRVGPADAEAMEVEYGPRYTANDLVNLPKYNVLLRLMINGVASQPFSAVTLPPYPRPEQSFREQIVDFSRREYASHRSEVDAAIRAWASPSSVGSDMFETICSRCGAETLVPFEPDESRPVYCRKCMVEVQKKRQAAAEAQKVTGSPLGAAGATPPSGGVAAAPVGARQAAAPISADVVPPVGVPPRPYQNSSNPWDRRSQEASRDRRSRKAPRNQRPREALRDRRSYVAPNDRRGLTDDRRWDLNRGQVHNSPSQAMSQNSPRPTLASAIERDRASREKQRKQPNPDALRAALKSALQPRRDSPPKTGGEAAS